MSRLPVVFLYPGQGSQYFGMCRELYETNDEFRGHMARCAELVAPYLDRPLPDIIYGSRPSRPFPDTAQATAAILAVEWSLTQLVISAGIAPAALVGYSLGEFVAAAVAGVFTLPQAFRLAMELAILLRRTCSHGALLAMLAPKELIGQNPAVFAGCEVAAVNAIAHHTLAGTPADVARVRTFLRSRDVLHEMLDIEYGFHSRLVDCAQAAFATSLRDLQPGMPAIPLVSATRARCLDVVPPHHFWDVVRTPVRFRQTVEHLEQRGPYVYLDLGPRGTLANLVKLNLNGSSGSRALATVTPFGSGRRALENLWAALAG